MRRETVLLNVDGISRDLQLMLNNSGGIQRYLGRGSPLPPFEHMNSVQGEGVAELKLFEASASCAACATCALHLPTCRASWPHLRHLPRDAGVVLAGFLATVPCRIRT